ncbi:hypothetical protein B9G53_24500 [Pseudanabaena sp. SR411]|uniref:pentapeptide repeat-containing protein n=1 Tax=Pseudanabaena sp. SR411 TaxID=1980935 RepID=UPI000B996127|nr:pentapeptide repeat-containing protein [Pseudanabaena sp. SR411]OYQ61986.1 hypothetical protein B9G53_24500 [Pseudanabaena sp. SR411]
MINDENFEQEAQQLIEKISGAKNTSFFDLAKIADLDLLKDFAGSDMSGTNLSNGILRNADLRETDLRGADLSHADLREANLSGANLSGANLSGANLSGANLERSNLTEALITKTTNFEKANVKSMIFGGERLLIQTIKQELVRRGAIFKDDKPTRPVYRMDRRIMSVEPLQNQAVPSVSFASRSSTSSFSNNLKSVLISHPDVEAVEIRGERNTDGMTRNRRSLRQGGTDRKAKNISAFIVLKDEIKPSPELKVILQQHVVEQSRTGEITITIPLEIHFTKVLPKTASRKKKGRRFRPDPDLKRRRKGRTSLSDRGQGQD